MSENINNTMENEIQEATTAAAAVDTACCKKPHHSKSKKSSIKNIVTDNSLLIGATIGATISTPLAIFFTKRSMKKKWLKAAAEFDAANAAAAMA